MESRLEEVLALHFDPRTGSPYWLEQVARWGFDPRCEVRRVEDLPRLGMMDQEALCDRPLGDFLPRGLRDERRSLIVVQTGGTLGRPIWTAYAESEFREAFVEPFVVAAQHVGFPRGGEWLYAGPSGPHVIGRAAEAIARATGSPAPFTVDFDSRWVKKLPSGSFAAKRYLVHVVQQAMAVLNRQPVTVIFTTPLVLDALAKAMTASQRERIQGVHYGGMAVEETVMKRFQQELFPNAVHLSGYGNTLFGCCLELDVSPERSLRYYPYGDRLVFGVMAGEKTPDADAVCYGRSEVAGRLVFSRLDRTMLIVNHCERDHAVVIAPPANAPRGYRHPGVEAPSPISETPAEAAAGLY